MSNEAKSFSTRPLKPFDYFFHMDGPYLIENFVHFPWCAHQMNDWLEQDEHSLTMYCIMPSSRKWIFYYHEIVIYEWISTTPVLRLSYMQLAVWGIPGPFITSLRPGGSLNVICTGLFDTNLTGTHRWIE